MGGAWHWHLPFVDYYQLFHLHYERGGFDSFEAFDERFRGTRFIYNWVQDLEMELHNAGLDKPVYFEHRIRFGECSLSIKTKLDFGEDGVNVSFASILRIVLILRFAAEGQGSIGGPPVPSVGSSDDGENDESSRRAAAMGRPVARAPQNLESPPANTPDRLVIPFSSTSILPRALSLSSGQVEVSRGLARVHLVKADRRAHYAALLTDERLTLHCPS